MAHNAACAASTTPPWECDCSCRGTLHGQAAAGVAIAGVDYSIPPQEPYLTREWLASQAAEFQRARDMVLDYTRRAHRDCVNHYAGWAERTPWPERQALVDYRGKGFTPVNSANRGLRRLTRRVRRQTEAIDRAIYSPPRTNRDLVVYRNFGYPELVALRRAGQLTAGYQFEEVAYSSTSLDVGVAKGYNDESGGLIGRLLIPRGTPAAYLDVIHDMGEREMLLPRAVGYEYRGDTSLRGLRVARFEVVDVPDSPVSIPYKARRTGEL